MARNAPSARATERVPSTMVSTGPSKKSPQTPVKSPSKGNLGAKIKRTSDIPKS